MLLEYVVVGNDIVLIVVLVPKAELAIVTIESGIDTNVTPELLKEVGLLKNQLDGVKVLGNGECTKKLTVKAHKFSKSAVEKLGSAGSKIEVL